MLRHSSADTVDTSWACILCPANLAKVDWSGKHLQSGLPLLFEHFKVQVYHVSLWGSLS